MYAQLKKRREFLDERRGSPDKAEHSAYSDGKAIGPGAETDARAGDEDAYHGDVETRAGELANHHQDLADAFSRMADEEEGAEGEPSSKDAVEDDPELMGAEIFGKQEPNSSGPLEGGSLRNTEDEEPLSGFEKFRKKKRQ
jgi:hypothetical protein